MAVMGTSTCKPAENSGDKKGSGWQTLQGLKSTGTKRFFVNMKDKRTQHYVIIVFILLLTFNLTAHSLMEAEKKVTAPFKIVFFSVHVLNTCGFLAVLLLLF